MKCFKNKTHASEEEDWEEKGVMTVNKEDTYLMEGKNFCKV